MPGIATPSIVPPSGAFGAGAGAGAGTGADGASGVSGAIPGAAIPNIVCAPAGRRAGAALGAGGGRRSGAENPSIVWFIVEGAGSGFGGSTFDGCGASG